MEAINIILVRDGMGQDRSAAVDEKCLNSGYILIYYWVVGCGKERSQTQPQKLELFEG